MVAHCRALPDYLMLICDKNDEETMNTLDSILNLMKLNLNLIIRK